MTPSDRPTIIRAIATDVDGTLLNNQHRLSPGNERVLRRAMAQGIHVIIATGKSRRSVEGVIEHLALDTPGVFVQGLVLTDGDGTVRYERTLPAAVARQIDALTEEDGYTLIAYSRDRIYMIRPREEWQQMLVRYHEPRAEVVGSMEALLAERQVNKLVVFCEQERIGAVREYLARHVDSQASLVQAVPAMLEIMPPGASKGQGLQRLLGELGIAPEHVMAIGDGENDVEMLRLAGLGVAVGNAADVAREAADVVVSTNDEDGVAEAIERFALRD